MIADVNERSSIVSNCPQQTFDVGRSLGDGLAAGDILLLEGGLGAGKTLLTKGILSAAGLDEDEVTSPSFALVNRYDTARLRVYHIDLWRLEPRTAAFAVGLEEMLDEPGVAIIIEWPDRLGKYMLHRPVIRVTIDGSGDEPRTIVVDRP